MEIEMFNTLFGPLLFATFAGVWGYYRRPETRDQLLFALTSLLVLCGAVSYRYPSPDLFTLLALYACVVTMLLALSLRPPVERLQ